VQSLSEEFQIISRVTIKLFIYCLFLVFVSTLLYYFGQAKEKKYPVYPMQKATIGGFLTRLFQT